MGENEVARQIVDAAFKVHSALGPGLFESVYERVLEYECRVEEWRGCLGLAYLLPALSSAGASIASPCPVSTPRSSNRTGAINASGSRTRLTHTFALEELPDQPRRL